MADPPSHIDPDTRVDTALLHASRNAGIAVLYQDRRLRTVWSHNLNPPWLESSHEGNGALPSQQADRLDSAKKNVLATGNADVLEISVADDGMGMRWFEIWIDADRTPAGKIKGVIVTVLDITEQKRREQTLKALLREVSHRSKNLLAIIQSIASQTGHYSGTIDGFLVSFRGRLQSIAASQDLVTSSNWRGASFRELVVGQLGRYSMDTEHTVRFAGTDPYLNPNAALHVGLAMHELAVNSVSFGALSHPDGYVEVEADLSQAPDGNEQMTLRWVEIIDIGIDATVRQKRFGSVALERVVPTALSGSAALDIGTDRLEYRLTMPRANFELE